MIQALKSLMPSQLRDHAIRAVIDRFHRIYYNSPVGMSVSPCQTLLDKSAES
jgi:hypothetical protein